MSDSAKVKFVINGEEQEYNVPVGEVNVLQAALNNGIHIDHACGAVGMCSTCRVTVKEGAENLSERTMAEDTFDVVGDDRLSCQCKINGDVTVEIPTA